MRTGEGFRPGIRFATAVAVAVVVHAAAVADHGPLGPVDPSDQEQLGIYEINRARSDPARYGQEVGLDLSGVAPQPPLAVNRNLTGSARFHALEMLDHHYFGHTSAVTGDGPNQMAADHGYDLFGNGTGFDWGATNAIESNARGVNRYPSYPGVIEDLIVDEGVPGAGHRVHLLALHPQFEAHREIGCGRAAGTDSFPEFGLPKPLPTRTYSIHTASDGTAAVFVTGVVFADRNGNLRYDAGEGLGGVTVDLGEGVLATTMDQGGYAIRVPGPGTYTAVCSGGSFVGSAAAKATIGSDNQAVDFLSGVPLGDVGFSFEQNGIPQGPDLTAAATPEHGGSPLVCSLEATSTGEDTEFSWDFADGGFEDGPSPAHTFQDPGLYPVVVEGLDSTGTGSALVLVSVEGEGGAGEGTTPPASTVLTGAAGAVKANFKLPGRDSAKFTGTLEMPAGFTPAGRAVQVSVAGLRFSFALDEKGKAVDGGGNKLALKYKRPKGEVPLAAGVIGKVTLKAKGDLARGLGAAGFRNRDESRTLGSVPYALLLEDLVYRGSSPFAAVSKKGKLSKGKLLRE